jgi:hypothetical protein
MSGFRINGTEPAKIPPFKGYLLYFDIARQKTNKVFWLIENPLNLINK